MKLFYTIFFVRKRDQKVIRRFQSWAHSKNDVMKNAEIQLNKVLNNYLDLEKRDVDVRIYDGTCETQPTENYGR